ncbi:MAG: hypothetical protein PUC44_03495 [Eubacteriales bacterium]|nr:hypothetical protein [Eubacteriales bacterium]
MRKLGVRRLFLMKRKCSWKSAAWNQEKSSLKQRGIWKKYQDHLLRRAREQEIFTSCMILKNLSIVQKDFPMSADFYLERLMEDSRYLRSIYGEMLLLWRSGMGEKAFFVLEERVQTKAAVNFSLILSKLDQVNPSELVSSMRSFEESFSEERVTRATRRAYIRSLIVTAASAASVFLILMNFIIVVIFLDMEVTLQNLLS